MIAKVICGRGNNREVIERERRFAFSQALGKAICRKLGLDDPKPSRPKFKRPRRKQA